MYSQDATGKLDHITEALPFISCLSFSIGETCGPAIKLRENGNQILGANFFDNIVCPLSSAIRLINSDFSEILQRKNLIVDSWENGPSVLDRGSGIYFHHYFYDRQNKKYKPGTKHILIEDEDLDAYLPVIRSQFTYMAEKFRRITRSDVRKKLYIREAQGFIYSPEQMRELSDTLQTFGARNFEIVHVYGFDDQLQEYPENVITKFIPERTDRWGASELWSEA